MICVIPHICKAAKDNSDSDHGNQVNNLINTLFHGEYEDKMAVTLDIFWTYYTEFDNKIGSFDADEFIWTIKDIRDGNSHLWHQKNHFLEPRFLILLYVDSHQKFLELVQQRVIGLM